MRKLQHRTNNAYDSILLVEDGEVIGAWRVGERGDEIANYNNPGNLDEWPETYPMETTPDAYGEITAWRVGERG